MLIFCWDGRFCFVFWGFGVGFRDWKQRVLLAFFVKTDYILKVGIFVLNGGNIFFFLTTKVGWWEGGGELLDTDLLNVMRLRSEITDALEVEKVVR